jgi:diguanylate cyclase (GGDEF)-like protein
VDPLTDLPTHEVFFSRLGPTIRLSSRAAMPMAVAVLDLDGFVALEQACGRPLARQLLVDVAEHLQAALRRSDTVARLGDDRFGLILNHITAFEAKRLLYKLWRSLALRPETLEQLGDSAARLTFTAGIAVFPGDSSDPHELYTRAELALDVARASGQRRVLLYAETSGDSGEDRHGTDLRYHRVQGASREEPE